MFKKCDLKELLFYSAVVYGVAVRLAFSAFSTHTDLETFWFSAQRFLTSTVDFYYFTHTSAGDWVYPPVWLWIVTGAYLFSFSSTGNDPSFLVLAKLPLIAADVVVALVLLRLLGNAKGKFAAAFWLVNPMSVFITSIVGQFDPIVGALLILSAYGLMRSKTGLAGVLYGVAIMTKQYAIFAAPVLAASVFRESGRSRALKFATIAASTALLISFPFLLSGARQVYLRNVWMTRSSVDYDDQCCQFAGLFQFLSWLHDELKIDLLSLFNLSCPALFMVLGLITGLAIVCRKIDYMKASLLPMIGFLAFSWYINPQYTVVFIPFLIFDVLSNNYSKYWLIVALLPYLEPLSTNGFGPYIGGLVYIPPLGWTAVAVSALIFFISLVVYMSLRIVQCLQHR